LGTALTNQNGIREEAQIKFWERFLLLKSLPYSHPPSKNVKIKKLKTTVPRPALPPTTRVRMFENRSIRRELGSNGENCEEKNFTVFKGRGNAIPLTGRVAPYGCEKSRLPHFLHNRLTDGCEFVVLTCRPPFIPRKIPGIHFY
jgi:hypothetical protein